MLGSGEVESQIERVRLDLQALFVFEYRQEHGERPSSQIIAQFESLLFSSLLLSSLWKAEHEAIVFLHQTLIHMASHTSEVERMCQGRHAPRRPLDTVVVRTFYSG